MSSTQKESTQNALHYYAISKKSQIFSFVQTHKPKIIKKTIFFFLMRITKEGGGGVRDR